MYWWKLITACKRHKDTLTIATSGLCAGVSENERGQADPHSEERWPHSPLSCSPSLFLPEVSVTHRQCESSPDQGHLVKRQTIAGVVPDSAAKVMFCLPPLREAVFLGWLFPSVFGILGGGLLPRPWATPWGES